MHHGVRIVRFVSHSEDRSDLCVRQRVLHSVVLAKILPLQRRVQVLELNTDASLAQQVLLGQIVVDLVLGLVQVILVVVVVVAVSALVVVSVPSLMVVSVPTLMVASVPIIMFVLAITFLVISITLGSNHRSHEEEEHEDPHAEEV